jgi:hypothetical protein
MNVPKCVQKKKLHADEVAQAAVDGNCVRRDGERDKSEEHLPVVIQFTTVQIFRFVKVTLRKYVLQEASRNRDELTQAKTGMNRPLPLEFLRKPIHRDICASGGDIGGHV